MHGGVLERAEDAACRPRVSLQPQSGLPIGIAAVSHDSPVVQALLEGPGLSADAAQQRALSIEHPASPGTQSQHTSS